MNLAPKEWTAYKMSKEFKVTQDLAKKAILVWEQKGILGKPLPKIGNRIPEEIVTRVRNFYCDDLNSRVMPDKKQCIRIKKNNAD